MNAILTQLGRFACFLARLILAAVLLLAAVAKLGDLQAFGEVIDKFGLLPGSLSLAAAPLLVACEMLAAVGILLNWKGGLELVTGLLFLFVSVLLLGIARGIDVGEACGCFGSASSPTLRTMLVFDTALLGLCFFLECWRQHHAQERLNPIAWLRRLRRARAGGGN